jgi:acyl carrier protein
MLTCQSLLDYFSGRLGVDVSGVDESTPLFSGSLLDSFSMVDLIMFIEKEGEIKMDVWDVTLDNLDSIARILQLVEEKRAQLQLEE